MHRLAYPVLLDPSLDRRPRDLESGGNFADRSTVIDDEAGDLQPVACCESSVWVCHGSPRRRKGVSRIRLTPSGCTCSSVGSRSR